MYFPLKKGYLVPNSAMVYISLYFFLPTFEENDGIFELGWLFLQTNFDFLQEVSGRSIFISADSSVVLISNKKNTSM